MPLVAVPPVKLGVTVSPPDTALSNVTVKVIDSPSAAEASAMVRARAAGGAVTVIVNVAVADRPPSSTARIVTV